MRLIDADALYETLKTDEEIAMERVSDTPLCFSDGTLNASFLSFLTQASDITNFKNMVYDAPTVDATDVVRCKDCKHRYIEAETWHCPFGLMGGENFYCGYGRLGKAERRQV